MKNYYLLLCSAIIVCFTSCKEESIAPTGIALETEHYPLEVGRVWVYQTDSVIFNKQLSSVDTLVGYMKEEISDEYINSGGEPSYVIERSFRRGLNDPWGVTDTYSASFVDNKATRSEENLRFVKLVFPTTLGQKWDGNQFFDESVIVNVGGEFIEVYKNWESEVTAVDSSVDINGIQYDNCTEVVLADNENFLEKRYVKEIYAKDIGLISKEMIILCTQNGDTNLDIIDRAEEGFVLTQSLIEYY